MRKSRRWLLASMGASAVAAAALKAQPFNPANACEKLALGVDLGGALNTDVKDKNAVRTALFAVFGLGLNYIPSACNDPGQKLDPEKLRQALTDFYSDAIDRTTFVAGQPWTILVLHTHILGQLTRFFWRTGSKPPDPNKLSLRHLGPAGQHFPKATSSKFCELYLCNSPNPNSLKAYILPKPKSLLQMEMLQIDQTCGLC
jgi:hypothetical protein